MSLRISVFLLALMAAGHAFAIDLNTIPNDFQFVSRGEDGVTTVTYVGQENGLFEFISDTDASLGKPQIFSYWTDSGSQIKHVTFDEGVIEFTPHGCGPWLGECAYVMTFPDGETGNMHRSTFMIGDVWVGTLYAIIDGEKIFQSQSCTTFDEYGFWIDYFRRKGDGSFEFGERLSSSHAPAPSTPLKDLRSMCQDAREMVS